MNVINIKILLSGGKHLGVRKVEIATQVINSFMNSTKQKWKTSDNAFLYLIFFKILDMGICEQCNLLEKY